MKDKNVIFAALIVAVAILLAALLHAIIITLVPHWDEMRQRSPLLDDYSPSATAVPTATLAAPPPTTAPLPEIVADPNGVPSPAPGTALTVVGVDHDDILNIRDAPMGEIIATIGLATGGIGCDDTMAYITDTVPQFWMHYGCSSLTATGASLPHGGGVWHEVVLVDSVDGITVTGWANARYLGQFGSYTDVTSMVRENLMDSDVTSVVRESLGESVTADTIPALARITAAAVFGDLTVYDTVMAVSAPAPIEGSDAVMDVFMESDDPTLRGYRLELTADTGNAKWLEDGSVELAGPYTLHFVFLRSLCHAHSPQCD